MPCNGNIGKDAVSPEMRKAIEENGPDTLTALLHQTDDLVARSPHWTRCQKAARYKTIVSLYNASRPTPIQITEAVDPDLPETSLVTAAWPDSAVAVDFDIVLFAEDGSVKTEEWLRAAARSTMAMLVSGASARNPVLHIVSPTRPDWLESVASAHYHHLPSGTSADSVLRWLGRMPAVAEHFVVVPCGWIPLAPLIPAVRATASEFAGTRNGTAFAGVAGHGAPLSAPRLFRCTNAAAAAPVAVDGPLLDSVRQILYLGSEIADTSSSNCVLACADVVLWPTAALRRFPRACLCESPDRSPLSRTPRIQTRSLNTKGAFLAFDQQFATYAAALIHSVLVRCPGWRIYAYATNVDDDTLSAYPFRHARVVVRRDVLKPCSVDELRYHMSCKRFLRYRQDFGAVDLALCLDADSILLGDPGDMGMSASDIGLVLRPYETAPERKLRACTVATTNTPQADVFWDRYKEALDSLPHAWYADQLALDRAKKESQSTVRALPERVYSSFSGKDGALVVETCTEDKLGFSRAATYAGLYAEAHREIDLIRHRDDTALVYVVFGDDVSRLSAIENGIRETCSSVDLPGRVLLLEAAEAPRLNALAEELSLEYIYLPTSDRHRGCWQKEALWEIARKRLDLDTRIKYAVFMDADCVPSERAFFSMVSDMHRTGVKVSQPWKVCADTEHSDIGGMSVAWKMSDKSKMADKPRSQPGFCWSFELAWLKSGGGFPNLEPIGGGDTLLVNAMLDAGHGYCVEAGHMQALADRSAFKSQPFKALDVNLKHHSHGPRSNRGYLLRYQVASWCLGDIMSVYVRDAAGLWALQPTPDGRAWGRMLARRGEWQSDQGMILGMWNECREDIRCV